MQLIIETTKTFEKTINKIAKKRELIYKINLLIDEIEKAKFECNKIANVRVFEIPIIEDIQSRLYVYKITGDFRVIFAVDKDILLDEVIITLYGITKPDSYNKLLRSITESQKQLFGVCSNESK